VIPGPAVHPDLAAFPALASSDQHGTARAVKVGFGEIQCLAVPEPARHSITIRARRRAPSRPSRAARMTATISSIVGGSAG